MSQEKVTAVGATHSVSVPEEARSFQGHRAGVVTRTAANVVDSLLAISLVLAGYIAWCVVRFLIKPSAFTFPAPPPLALLACLLALFLRD